MSTTLRRAVTAASALALATVLAACNGGGGGGGGGELDYEDSPLTSYYESFDAMGDMTQEEQEAFYNERQRKQEELTAQCMAEQGFDYTPVEYPGSVVSFGNDEDGDGPEWGTVEFAQQYGYQVFTWEEQEAPVDEEAEDWVDPNWEAYEAMSDSEKTAYDEALWGGPSEEEFDPDADMEEFEWNWETAGCQGWAQHELEADDPWAGMMQLQEDPRFTELFEGLNDIWTDLQSDPRMAELDSEWASCMADEGYTFATPQEAQESFYELSNTMWDDHDGTDTWEPDPELIEQYKTQEIETAVADYTCQEKIDYQQEQLKVQFAIEQEFVDANKDALEEFAAAAQELQK